MGIRASTTMAAEHADALWAILGPACFDVFPDALETLQALRARGVPLAVVSNWQSGLRHFCAELGLADYFDHVLSSADLGVQKPDRRIFLEACARLGIPPERTLHVGDTDLDVRDARAVRSLSDLLDVVVEPEGGDGGHS
jgi:HAD superfamily hydrolase (TIGR01549 family)